MALYDRIANRVYGSPYDRGASDSYYGRGTDPHKWVILAAGGHDRVEDLTAYEREQYLQGFADNEAEHNFKDWG